MMRKRGFVALLDVLGFSERVARDGELHGLDSYINTVLEETKPYSRLRVILFSDTVLIYTLDDAQESLAEIVAATSRVTYSLLAKEVPIRGAIAHGTFARSADGRSGTVVAGRPIIEAHSYEAELQWLGVVLAPSVLRQVPDLPSRGVVYGPKNCEDRDAYFARVTREARVRPCSCIPVESSPGLALSHLDGFAVVPLSGTARSPQDLLQCMTDNLAKLRWLKHLAPDPRSQAKYQNAIDWLSPLYIQWIERLH